MDNRKECTTVNEYTMHLGNDFSSVADTFSGLLRMVQEKNYTVRVVGTVLARAEYLIFLFNQ